MLTFVLLLFGAALCLSVTLYLSLKLDQQQRALTTTTTTRLLTSTTSTRLLTSTTLTPPPTSPPLTLPHASADIVMVLAMHHSGTSLLTRILIEMGLFGGDRADFKLQTAQQHHGRAEPPKYWERLDVIAATEQLINRSTANAAVLARDRKLGWLTGFAFRASAVPPRLAADYADRIRATVDLLRSALNHSLDHALVLKEPRLSLTWSLWRPVLLAASLRPVCVILYRHPLLVAAGLRWRPRNRAMLLDDWLALWEKYTVGTLRACHGLPKVLVAHDALARSPATTVDEVFRALQRLGVPGLRPVPPDWLAAFLPPYNATPPSAALDEPLTLRQRALWQLFESGDAARDSDEFLDGDVDAMAERELVDDDASSAPPPVVLFDSLRSALDAVADAERNVVLIPSNTFFSDLVRNQICSIRAVAPGLRPIALGLDDHFCDAMSGLDAACYYDRSFGVGVADHQRWTLEADSQYMTILLLKMAYVEKAINLGFNVLLADADIAWRADARSALLRLVESQPADLLIQSDARRNVAEKSNWICAGFFYMRANERTSMFMRATREIMLAFGAPDQDVWQLLLRGTGQNVQFPSDWKTARNGQPWLDAADLGMTYHELNSTEYANGGRFFSGDASAAEHDAAIIAHANMRGFPMKVKAFQKHGLWHVDKLNVDRCL